MKIMEYPLDTLVQIPNPYKILHAGLDEFNSLYVWVEVHPNGEMTGARFQTLKTGKEVPYGWRHIASCVYNEVMYHIYDETPVLPVELMYPSHGTPSEDS